MTDTALAFGILLLAFLGALLGAQFGGREHELRVCEGCGTENLVCLKSKQPRCGSCLEALGEP
jgi:hypothetical protein